MITANEARSISDEVNEGEEIDELTMQKQLDSINVDIYNAACEGDNDVKTALLLDDIDFFEELSERLQESGFKDLYFLSIDIDGQKSAALEIKW